MPDFNVAPPGTLITNAQKGAGTNTSAKGLADQAGVPEQRELFEQQDPQAEAAVGGRTVDPRQTLKTGGPTTTTPGKTDGPEAAQTAATGPAPTGDDDSDVEMSPELMAALQGKGDAEQELVNGLNAANTGPVKNAASGQQPSPTTANGAGGGGGVKTPWPPNGNGAQQPGNIGSQLGSGQYGTAGNTFTDVATRQKAIQDDLNQAQTIYMQMAADRYKWLSTMQRIWMDMRTSVLENILGATKNMVAQMEKIQDGFIQLMES